MQDWGDTIDQISERLGAPANAVRLTLQPLEASAFSKEAWSQWARGEDVADVGSEGYTCGMLIRDWKIPSFSALQLICWLERSPDRVQPFVSEFYTKLRDCPDRPVDADPNTITHRLRVEAGVYSDGPLLGYDVLACVPELQIAFWHWWAHGSMPDVRMDGFSLNSLADATSSNAAERHPVQALLTLDWLAKQPEAARPSLLRK